MSKLAIHGGQPVRESFLVYGAPDIGDEEIQAVVNCIKTGWLSTGPNVQKFEADIKNYTGAKHAVAANSCTALLHLSLIAHNIGPGDEVITTPMTFGATVNVIEHVGAKPILADLLPKSFHIDPQSIKSKITPKTKAIMPVHYAGSPCQMDEINAIAKEYNLVVIEDAAHAIGAKYKGTLIGDGQNLTSFSLYVTKNIAAGEGGVLTTNSDELAEKIRIYGLHGMSRGAWQRYSKNSQIHYDIVVPGYKYNMPDMNAAMAIEQLKKLEIFTKKRKAIAETYFERLADENGLELPHALIEQNEGDLCTWHIFPILINPEVLKGNREEIMTALIQENIGVATHYRAIYEQQFYKEKYGLVPSNFPNCEMISKRIFSIPLSTSMSTQDIEDVVSGIKKVFGYFKK
ncbi:MULTISPECIES: DegT/DnrJ/EryC1/StrS aminotransferase family protein [Leptospira]|uniref:Putative spore coat polysaccharide biosynthesis protein SpsC n=1 Tax=Leptospira weilii str. Ecochallenge TaxID=1049986 RepID=N1U1L7_9LEPT|nr:MULTISPECIES: DegT/DnrJ/EryC1/StrS family aminotransferase [Leptospira]EMJ65011.1 putative spore coat polysaccharide biosynthesis protein SpsC [Leptospira sp. P2653]EMY12902.1 putative spore coat polysaccharide biosynthesis protein SpsC [Leptospira weilii str. Ecochallenge]